MGTKSAALTRKFSVLNIGMYIYGLDLLVIYIVSGTLRKY